MTQSTDLNPPLGFGGAYGYSLYSALDDLELNQGISEMHTKRKAIHVYEMHANSHPSAFNGFIRQLALATFMP